MNTYADDLATLIEHLGLAERLKKNGAGANRLLHR
jgi:hypothetical protein